MSERKGRTDHRRPVRRIRHPIYAFSMLLMLCSAVIVATMPMMVVAAIHVVLMNLKARNEERHLLHAHGDAYASYLRRTGRFLPRSAGSLARRDLRPRAANGRAADARAGRALAIAQSGACRDQLARCCIPLAPAATDPALAARISRARPRAAVRRRCARRSGARRRRRGSSRCRAASPASPWSRSRISRRDGLPGGTPPQSADGTFLFELSQTARARRVARVVLRARRHDADADRPQPGRDAGDPDALRTGRRVLRFDPVVDPHTGETLHRTTIVDPETGAPRPV